MSVFGALAGAAGAAPSTGKEIAGLAPTRRQNTIHIKNESSNYTLSDPMTYTFSGHCHEPLPPTIRPSKSGRALFMKTPDTLRGSVGVFTYDLINDSTHQCSGKMAVMFSNPYNFNQYSNIFAVGVFDMNKKCDYDLYNEMYYCAKKGFVRGKAKDGGLTYKSSVVTIRATMSDSYQPVIKVQVFQQLK